MIARYNYLSQNPNVFKSMTGLRLSEFDTLAWEVQPLLAKERLERLSYSPENAPLVRVGCLNSKLATKS